MPAAAALSVPFEAVLVVDDDVIVRAALAEYLRHCGYQVMEASGVAEAIAVLEAPRTDVDVVLSAVEMNNGGDGFELSRWVRMNRPKIGVILAGTPKRAADSAAELCEKGPELARPYEPQVVHDRIRRLLADRQNRPGSK
jgi:CheY-like chemotaxis protein